MTWCQTFTGKRFDYARTMPDMVDIEDIARALSMQCRFNGHVSEFYSVAQHSVHVAAHLGHLPPKGRLQGLLHDATEAYIGDVVRPLKRLMPIYAIIEERVWLAVCEHFDITEVMHPDVLKADEQMLIREAMDLLPVDILAEWDENEGPSELVASITPLDPGRAERLFMMSYRALAREISNGTTT